MRLAPLFLILTGCLTEHQQLLKTWHGVYEVQRTTQNIESCDVEGETIANEVDWMEIVTEAGPEADLVDLRRCDSKTDCERIGFVTFVAPLATQKVLDGGIADVFFTSLGSEGGLCQVQYDAVTILRPNDKSRDLRVEIRSSTATDVIAATEEVCNELLQIMVEDPDGCDAYKVFEGRRVND